MFSPIPSEKEQTPNKHNQIKDGYHNFGIDHNGNIIKRDFDIESYLNFDENKENESLVAVDSNGDLQKTRTFSPFKFNSNFSFSNEIEHEDNDSIKEIGLGLNNNDFRNALKKNYKPNPPSKVNTKNYKIERTPQNNLPLLRDSSTTYSEVSGKGLNIHQHQQHQQISNNKDVEVESDYKATDVSRKEVNGQFSKKTDFFLQMNNEQIPPSRKRFTDDTTELENSDNNPKIGHFLNINKNDTFRSNSNNNNNNNSNNGNENDDFKCGVLTTRGTCCRRRLTCNSHTDEQKSSVFRSKPYEFILKEFMEQQRLGKKDKVTKVDNEEDLQLENEKAKRTYKKRKTKNDKMFLSNAPLLIQHPTFPSLDIQNQFADLHSTESMIQRSRFALRQPTEITPKFLTRHHAHADDGLHNNMLLSVQASSNLNYNNSEQQHEFVRANEIAEIHSTNQVYGKTNIPPTLQPKENENYYLERYLENGNSYNANHLDELNLENNVNLHYENDNQNTLLALALLEENNNTVEINQESGDFNRIHNDIHPVYTTQAKSVYNRNDLNKEEQASKTLYHPQPKKVTNHLRKAEDTIGENHEEPAFKAKNKSDKKSSKEQKSKESHLNNIDLHDPCIELLNSFVIDPTPIDNNEFSFDVNDLLKDIETQDESDETYNKPELLEEKKNSKERDQEASGCDDSRVTSFRVSMLKELLKRKSVKKLTHQFSEDLVNYQIKMVKILLMDIKNMSEEERLAQIQVRFQNNN